VGIIGTVFDLIREAGVIDQEFGLRAAEVPAPAGPGAPEGDA
jgi:hypothetical protein